MPPPPIFISNNVFLCSFQIQNLAIRCIQKNIKKNRGVKGWPWWKLFTTVRPLIEVQLTEEQIRGKDVSAALMMIDELIINKLYAWFQPLNHQSLYNNILFWFRLLGFPQISRKFH